MVKSAWVFPRAEEANGNTRPGSLFEGDSTTVHRSLNLRFCGLYSGVALGPQRIRASLNLLFPKMSTN